MATITYYLPDKDKKQFMIDVDGIRQFFRLRNQSEAIRFAIYYITKYSQMNTDPGETPEYQTFSKLELEYFLKQYAVDLLKSIIETAEGEVVKKAQDIVNEFLQKRVKND